MSQTSLWKAILALTFIAVCSLQRASAIDYTVVTTPESSPTWPAGHVYLTCTSQTSDPLGPFSNDPVTFLGWQNGGSSETLNGAHLIYRYQITFPEDVQISSITVVGGGDYSSGGNNATLRLLDQNRNVLGALATSNLPFTICPNTYTLNVTGASGTTFFIDEFDYSTNQRYRAQIAITYSPINCQAAGPGVPAPPGFIGTVMLDPTGPSENAAFAPIGGLEAAENACGFTAFNWQQMVTVLPPVSSLQPNDPGPLINSGNVVVPGGGSASACLSNWNGCYLTAPPNFSDPPQGEYTIFNILPGYNPVPFYYPSSSVSPGAPLACTIPSLSAANCPPFPYVISADGSTLSFLDAPAIHALPGDPASPNPAAGHFVAFNTALVGVDSAGNAQNLYSWTWNSTFNGKAGGVSQTASLYPIDPGSGTGGVTITSINGVSLIPTPPSGTACNGMYNGAFNGSITVSTGQNCTFVGGSITGDVTVTGGTLVLSGVSVSGDVNVNGGGSFYIGSSATISGDLKIQNIPAGHGQNQICGSTVNGDLQFLSNGTAAQIGSSQASCPGNTVDGDLVVNNNTASTQVFNNNIKQDLNCKSNSSITGGGNTASSKTGQCKNF